MELAILTELLKVRSCCILGFTAEVKGVDRRDLMEDCDPRGVRQAVVSARAKAGPCARGATTALAEAAPLLRANDRNIVFLRLVDKLNAIGVHARAIERLRRQVRHFLRFLCKFLAGTSRKLGDDLVAVSWGSGGNRTASLPDSRSPSFAVLAVRPLPLCTVRIR